MDCTSSIGTQQALPHRHGPASTDVLVVGAGPAGALLAYLLARAGLRVVLVERAALPRVKPCGGGLNWKTLQLLPFIVERATERVVSRVLFTQRLRQAFARTYPQPLVTMVTRCTFDHWLVEHAAAAGVAVYDDCRITQIEAEPQGFRLRADGVAWRSRYVAFADGAKGTLRRQLGFTATAPHDIGLDLDIEAEPPCPWEPDTLYIDWGTTPQTYAWAFPKAQHWSIGVKGPASHGPTLARYLRQFMQRWQLPAAQDKLPYLAHMLPTRHAGMPVVRGRALVLGDAAGLLEPFTGEGIYYALRSAHLAAAALQTAIVTDTAPLAYTAAIEAELMPELLGARALQQLFDAWPWCFHTLLRLHPRSWRAFAKIIRGERGFRDIAGILHRHPTLLRAALWPSQDAAQVAKT